MEVFSIELERFTEKSLDISEACCNICLKISSEMFECQDCQTIFCHTCTELIKFCSKICYYCKKDIHFEKTVKNVQQIIDESLYFCCNQLQGCQGQFFRQDLKQHELICKFDRKDISGDLENLKLSPINSKQKLSPIKSEATPIASKAVPIVSKPISKETIITIRKQPERNKKKQQSDQI